MNKKMRPDCGAFCFTYKMEHQNARPRILVPDGGYSTPIANISKIFFRSSLSFILWREVATFSKCLISSFSSPCRRRALTNFLGIFPSVDFFDLAILSPSPFQSDCRHYIITVANKQVG